MILLVTRLGLRSIDVKRLTFSCLKWEENRMEIIQSKTGETLHLPLLKDVGWAMIVKYMRMAKIPLSGKKKTGMHSLRRMLATTLMEQHVPLQEIADILGHQDIESTPVYLKSSLKLLRECSLNPEMP
jgi:integrase